MSLFGTIAPTDFGWYDFLSTHQSTWTEVNFWTPSTHFSFRAVEFSPFFFKLKAPHNAIGGFGLFARYSALPDWLAWECFSEANGCASLAAMRQRLSTIRQRMRFAGGIGLVEIGCIVLVNVHFFPRELWIPQPSDWPARNLRPMRYALDHGEGRRVWAECLDRQQTSIPAPTVEEETAGARYGSPMLMRPRLGQGAFRLAVTDAYQRACAVTNEHSLPALDAAHIQPFALDGPHAVSNGILLRADVHRLFEQGYLTISPEFKLEVSGRLRTDYQNGKSYYPLHGQVVMIPPSSHDRPDPAALRWHNDSVFLG